MTDPAAVERLLLHLAPEHSGVAVRASAAGFVPRLTSDERALVASARSTRVVEFATGRACAHRALACIGRDVATVGRGERRQPAWPKGVTGSISHAAGLAAAVTIPVDAHVTSLGIDLEHDEGADRELWPAVLRPDERAWCDAAPDPVRAATAVFTAKEAAFKALYPVTGIEVDFLDADVDLVEGTVTVPDLARVITVRQGRVPSVVASVATISSLG